MISSFHSLSLRLFTLAALLSALAVPVACELLFPAEQEEDPRRRPADKDDDDDGGREGEGEG